MQDRLSLAYYGNTTSPYDNREISMPIFVYIKKTLNKYCSNHMVKCLSAPLVLPRTMDHCAYGRVAGRQIAYQGRGILPRYLITYGRLGIILAERYLTAADRTCQDLTRLQICQQTLLGILDRYCVYALRPKQKVSGCCCGAAKIFYTNLSALSAVQQSGCFSVLGRYLALLGAVIIVGTCPSRYLLPRSLERLSASVVGVRYVPVIDPAPQPCASRIFWFLRASTTPDSGAGSGPPTVITASWAINLTE